MQSTLYEKITVMDSREKKVFAILTGNLGSRPVQCAESHNE